MKMATTKFSGNKIWNV